MELVATARYRATADQLARTAPRILRTLASGRGMQSHAHGMRKSRGIPRPLALYMYAVTAKLVLTKRPCDDTR